MVMLRTFLVVGFVALPLTASAITPEELARLSEKGAVDKRRAAKELDLEDLRYPVQLPHQQQLAPAPANTTRPASTTAPAPAIDTVYEPATTSDTDEVESADAGQKNRAAETAVPQASSQSPSPVSSKYARSQGRTPHPQTVRQMRRQQHDNSGQDVRHGSAFARPASPTSMQRSASGYASSDMPNKAVYYSDAVEVDTARYYGIRRGSWIKAELRRNINSAEPGDVELYTTHDTHGDKKTLSANTQLFAEKGFTGATQRLDMLSTYAITPDGREFELKARVYDTRKVSGLNGIVDVDESKLAERGMSQALASLGTSVLEEVGGQNIIGHSLSRGGQTMIQDGQRAIQQETQQQITIFVAPQPILLRVEETF